MHAKRRIRIGARRALRFVQALGTAVPGAAEQRFPELERLARAVLHASASFERRISTCLADAEICVVEIGFEETLNAMPILERNSALRTDCEGVVSFCCYYQKETSLRRARIKGVCRCKRRGCTPETPAGFFSGPVFYPRENFGLFVFHWPPRATRASMSALMRRYPAAVKWRRSERG